MSYTGNNPKQVTSTLKPQSTDPSNPTEGMIFYSDGTPRPAGIWLYKGGIWNAVEDNVSPLGGPIPYVETSTSLTASVNSGYITNDASAVQITLPVNSDVGDVISIIGKGAGGWEVVSNASVPAQTIKKQADSSSTSANSAVTLLKSDDPTDVAYLVCTVANSEWIVRSGFGSVVVTTNYYGDSSLGDVSTGGDVTHTSTQDGDMVVLNYRNLTINDGHTISVSNRCRGMLMYVNGDLTLNGTGKISMSAKGCHANPADAVVTADTPVAPTDGNSVPAGGIVIRRLKTGGTDSNSDTDLFYGCGTAAVNSEANQGVLSANGVVYTIPRVGAAGGAGVGPASSSGSTGGTGTNGQTGGGGSGAANTRVSEQGGDGTCFSGGSGSAGERNNEGSVVSDFGGPGGSVPGSGQGGGVGNPGGTGDSNGADGTGGLLIIIVAGNVTLAAASRIEANGVDNNSSGSVTFLGGSSGGGSVLLLHGGTLTNNGTIEASGGAAVEGATPGIAGGAGGAGSVQIDNIL